MIRTYDLSGVWSATPTPFTGKMRLDTVAVRRMVKHHLRLGVKGLFVGGTTGEGPWMTDGQRCKLIEIVAKQSNRQLLIAAQVSDNSAARVIDNIRIIKKCGAHIAVIAPPDLFYNATPKRLLDHYLESIEKSPLPIGIYHRGNSSHIEVPENVLTKVAAHPKVVIIKDSSSDAKHRKRLLAARKKNPRLKLLNGNEFQCVDYLEAGYDGLLLGGGIFNGLLARMICEAVAAGDLAQARKLERRLVRINYAVYGGKLLKCWLTGLKELLVAMKIFRTSNSYLCFPMTYSCREAITRILDNDRDVLI